MTPERLRAARERDRLEAEIDRLSARVEERGAALQRTRAALDAVREDPIVRAYRGARTVGARLLGRRRVSPPRPVVTSSSRAASASVEAQEPAKRQLRVTFVGQPGQLREQARRLGWQVVDGAEPSDVAFVMEPRLLGPPGSTAFQAGWVEDQVTDAAVLERLADLDLLIVPEPGLRGRLEQLHGRVHQPPSAEELDGWLRRELDRPRAAVHIGPPDRRAAATWGDTWFGRSLVAALRRQGWLARLLFANEENVPFSRNADLAIHVVGRRRPESRSGQLSALWVISHPDDLRTATCEAFDAVFVASALFADALRDRVAVPVVTLHQATDPARFFPEPGGPAHDLLFVGNSRGRRRSTLDALADGPWDLAVYGTNWTPALLDPDRLRGGWIPDQDVHRYYAAASIVLNDHWPDMRDEGFASNRIYDALASGAFVLSDAVLGLDDRFEGAVPSWQDAGDLRAAVSRYLADPNARASMAARGREVVLARHTFDHRAAELMAALAPMARAKGTRWPGDGVQTEASEA